MFFYCKTVRCGQKQPETPVFMRVPGITKRAWENVRKVLGRGRFSVRGGEKRRRGRKMRDARWDGEDATGSGKLPRRRRPPAGETAAAGSVEEAGIGLQDDRAAGNINILVILEDVFLEGFARTERDGEMVEIIQLDVDFAPCFA